MTALDRSPAVTVLERWEDLESLGPEWDELLRDADGAGIFLTHAWVAAWAATVGAETRPMVAVAREAAGGRLVGIAPLMVTRGRRGGVAYDTLRMAGSGLAAADHLDLIVRHGHPHVVAELWRAVSQRRTWEVVDLQGLRPASHLSRLLLRRRGDRAAFASPMPCPVLDLPDTWEEYVAGLGRNLRTNLGRYGRKLDREAPAPVVERLVTDPAEAADTAVELALLNERNRRERGSSGSFADPRMVDLHREAAVRMLEAGRLRLHRLDVGDRMIAGISCFRHDDTVSFYVTGFTPDYGRYGPGRRVIAAAIRGAIEEGAGRFDFLRGAEEYKSTWGAVPIDDDRIRFPIGARARLAAQVIGAARRLLRR